MTEAGPTPSLETALRSAAPHALLETSRVVLADRLGVREVVVLLADYGAVVLRPLGGGDPSPESEVPVGHGPAGRAFSTQSPVVEMEGDGDVRAHFPMSVRGDRLGVMTVTLSAGDATREALDTLAAFAEAFGHEVVTAGRDTDIYRLARRRRRLTLAAEMQWALLPGRGCVGHEYEIGAHLEPAYAIGGDNYDWDTAPGSLFLSVTDGRGNGMHAALLTELAVNALRNARRAGLPPAEQASLADQAVFAHYRGRSHAATLLLRFDTATGVVEAVDAGSPRVYRLRAGEVSVVGLEAQLPLGMFEDTEYVAQSFTVEPGDRLVIVGTGVHETLSASGASYGDRELPRRVRATRLAGPSETARAVVDGVMEHFGRSELDADASVVCVDWHGGSSAARG